jgi:hypothetical protein
MWLKNNWSWEVFFFAVHWICSEFGSEEKFSRIGGSGIELFGHLLKI